MTTFVVTRKPDGAEITRYAAMSPVEQIDDLAVPFADFEHVEFIAGATDVTPTSYTWTKLAYLRRFTQDERIAIRSAAPQSAQLADYLELLALAEEVKSDDPDIITALTMLEGTGLLAAGRAQEILNGQ